jgi:hypothetical protein
LTAWFSFTEDFDASKKVRKSREKFDSRPTCGLPQYFSKNVHQHRQGLRYPIDDRILAGEKNAALKNIRVSIDGLLDPSLAMGQDSDNRAGFIHLNANISMDSDLPADQQNRFIDEFGRRCPLCDTIMNETILQTCFLFQK